MKNCYQGAKIKCFRSYVLKSVAERKGRKEGKHTLTIRNRGGTNPATPHLCH